ncbi:hypothetical protein QBC43DRAFT_46622 [Cladorrhinum sp. PSN259]|nr:hypothetical protein QBC43DRAFT_46622 [Cladorrhinum sp. PSN259]
MQIVVQLHQYSPPAAIFKDQLLMDIHMMLFACYGLMMILMKMKKGLRIVVRRLCCASCLCRRGIGSSFLLIALKYLVLVLLAWSISTWCCDIETPTCCCCCLSSTSAWRCLYNWTL